MMDDLDHSIHIAEYEWESFFEECEGCSVLQPSLADMDNLSLSDAEDCGSTANQVSDLGCRDLQKGTVANTDTCQTNTAGVITVEDCCIGFTMQSIQGEKSNNKKGQTYYLTTEDEEVQENTIEIIEATKYTIGTSKHDDETLFCLDSSMNANINMMDNTEKALHEVGASTSLRSEKERWFVTVNDSSSRKRAHDTTNAKKKRRKKKTSQKVCNMPGSLFEYNSDCKKNKAESKEKKDIVYHNSSSSNSLQKSIQRELAQMHTILPLNNEGGDVLPNAEIPPIHKGYLMHVGPNKDHICSENTENPLKFTSSTFTSKEDDASLDNTESEDFEDGVDMLSTNSCDSESYLSTNESTEECICQFNLTEEQHVETKEPLQQLKSTQTLQRRDVLHEPASAENMQGTQMYTLQNVDFRSLASKVGNPQLSLEDCFPHDLLSKQNESCDQIYAAHPVTFSPASQSSIMTDDNSKPDINMHRSLSDMPFDLPKALTHKPSTGTKIPLSSGPPTPPPSVVPEVTATPLADSPEEYAQSLGHSRPVYAISAFWDEMEKLTINDILQLNMTRSSSPNIQEIGRPHGDVLHTEMWDTAESFIPDGASVETSDTADSDYFTHLGDHKLDRSSCGFSPFSDLDEEYYYAGTSRDPSPDCHDVNQQSHRTTVSNSTACDLQAEHTKPVEAVPIEQWVEGPTQNIFLSNEFIYARGITRSRSMLNVQAFNSQFQLKDSHFKPGNAQNRHQDIQSQKENTFRRANDNIMLTPAPILSNTDILDETYRITFPEVFEYFFSEDLANHGCIAVFDSESMPRSTLQEEDKLIPIFSFKHSTVEELTFPELDYLLFPQEQDIKERDFTSAASDDAHFNQKGWSRWKSWLSMRKVHFPGMCSSWFRTSGAWVFPVGSQSSPLQRSNQTIPMLMERTDASFSAQVFREVAAQQRLMTLLWTPVSLSKQEGLFSTLKQSDMCLVCIAVATWVLRSSDPRASDTWKAALLANVSALSAIQYLRHYVKKDTPGPEP